MKYIKFLLNISTIFFFFSCTELKDKPFQNFVYNCTLTEDKGSHYPLPEKLIFNDSAILTKFPEWLNEFYLNILTLSDEKSLSNCYLGKNLVRITLIPRNEKVKLIMFVQSKELDENVSLEIKELSVKAAELVPSKNVKKLPQVNYIQKDSSINLSWKDMENIFSDFFSFQNYDDKIFHDGGRILVEYHSENIYWFIERQTPLKSNEKLSLIKLLNSLNSVSSNSIASALIDE